MKGRARRKARRGVAALEFALVLPLLITIVLACVDFGRFAYTYIAVTNAAREGCWFAARYPSYSYSAGVWSESVAAHAREEMGGAFVATDIVVTALCADPTSSERWAQVSVSYPFRTIVSWPTIPSNMTLSRTVTMRIL